MTKEVKELSQKPRPFKLRLANLGAAAIMALGSCGMGASWAQEEEPTNGPVAAESSGVPQEQETLVGQGVARTGLAYVDRTNFSDPRVKANVEQDLQYVNSLANSLPILGYPLVSLSAQDRYGYTFNAVNKDSLGTYNKGVNQLFLNMEIGSKQPIVLEHLIFHEMAHYLSVRQNRSNLTPYLTIEVADQAEVAEVDLLNQIRRYDQNPNLEASDAFFEKLELKTPVTWDEIIDAANSYPAFVWQNPKDFLQFSASSKLDMEQVRRRADDELIAEFTSFLQQAQKVGLYEADYQQPVYQIFSDLKAGNTYTQP